MQVSVGYAGKIYRYEGPNIDSDNKRALAYEILDYWLAFHASEVVADLGSYSEDEWDLVKGTVSRGRKHLMFAAKPCAGKPALFTVEF